jgi:hypothetical protein
MVAPWPREPLLLYITTSPRTASAVIIAEQDAQVIAKEKIDTLRLWAPPKEGSSPLAIPCEEPPPISTTPEPLLPSDSPEPPDEATSASVTKVQQPVYFISTMLRDARECYTTQQKLLYTLLIASRKLRHYFQGHPIMVITDQPLEQIVRNPSVNGRVAEWAELQPFEITFKTTKVIKSKALTEFTAIGVLDTGVSRSTCSLATLMAHLRPRSAMKTEAQQRRLS